MADRAPDAGEMTLAPLALEGWFVLHQLFVVDRLPDPGPARDTRDARARRAQDLFERWGDLGDDGWSGLYRIVGGRADLMAVHFRPTLDALGHAERVLRLHPAAADLELASDYVSVVELGLYRLTETLVERATEEGIPLQSAEWNALAEAALAEEREKSYVQRRLFPRQPDDMPYVSFYPMDKRRVVGQNWYTLPLARRARMMSDHGRIGRQYAGKVSQVISGSVGFDDWEWAVTLFAGDPLRFKELVTEMRYDEVSAVYADFGSFWVGRRVPTEAIAAELAGHGVDA